MSLKTVWFCACIVCLMTGRYLAIGSGDQSAEDHAVAGEQASIIRISSNLVTVPVSVTDSEGHAVGNLEIQDFLVEEDGRPETVSRIAEAGRSPMRLALLIDLSGSVNARFDFEQRAAIRFLEKVWRSDDTISVVPFSDNPRMRIRTSGSLSDALMVLLALEPTEDPTAFFDAVVLSAKTLRQSSGPETRRAIIALSDGEDNRSSHNFSEALSEVQRADTVFYSINPGGSSIRLNEISLKAQSDLASLAKETGGNAFVSDKTGDLDGIFLRIATELRAQYLLSYYSANSRIDGKYRRISVSIPNRNGLCVRTRRGYYASPK
jgi:Ca-activated chloride channel homolog